MRMHVCIHAYACLCLPANSMARVRNLVEKVNVVVKSKANQYFRRSVCMLTACLSV